MMLQKQKSNCIVGRFVGSDAEHSNCHTLKKLPLFQKCLNGVHIFSHFFALYGKKLMAIRNRCYIPQIESRKSKVSAMAV